MRNTTLLYSITIVLMGVTATTAMGDSKNMQCTYFTNRNIAKLLRPGTSAVEVINYLRRGKINFIVFSEDEQEINISKLDEKAIVKLGKISIISGQKRQYEKKIITEGEMLIIEFEENQIFQKYRCKKYYTGP